MKSKRFSLFLLLVLIAGIESIVAAQHLHPKIKSKEKIIRSVIILPPKVEVTKSGMKGAEGMLQESGQVEGAIIGMVARSLRGKGFNVIESPFTTQAFNDNDDSKYALADIQNRYDALAPKLLKKPKDVTKGRFSLGDQVTNLNASAPADVLVFIRGAGTKLTSGKKTFGWLIGGPKYSMISLSIALVDSQTGNVLCLTTTGGAGEFVDNPEKVLGKPIAKSLKKLPGAL